MVFAADIPEEEIFDRVQPLLAYGEMYRNAVLAGRELSDLAMQDGLTGLPDRPPFLARSRPVFRDGTPHRAAPLLHRNGYR